MKLKTKKFQHVTLLTDKHGNLLEVVENPKENKTIANKMVRSFPDYLGSFVILGIVFMIVAGLVLSVYMIVSMPKFMIPFGIFMMFMYMMYFLTPSQR